jgi:hypothetical protein
MEKDKRKLLETSIESKMRARNLPKAGPVLGVDFLPISNPGYGGEGGGELGKLED